MINYIKYTLKLFLGKEELRLKLFKYYVKYIDKKIYIAPSFKQIKVLKKVILEESIFHENLYKTFNKNDKRTILDIGGNIGYSTISYKKAIPNSVIIAFERIAKSRTVE